MLFIWDIHISSKYKDSILNEIEKFVDTNSDEENLVFLWDFVYHFIYDRKAILEFFGLILKFYSQWKNIYILAWNHDWIQWSFVFEEARRSFDILNTFENKNKIYFITKPLEMEIEWNSFLFLPYDYDFNEKNVISDGSAFWKITKELSSSTNKNETLSWAINAYLYNYILQNSEKKLFIVHHYYFEWVEFPAQRARFHYKDVALSKEFFDYKNIYFISGHLHQGFAYKNYLCTGSVWNTSPLEQNQIKFLYKFSPAGLKVQAFPIYINPYFTIDLKYVPEEKSEELPSQWLFGEENLTIDSGEKFWKEQLQLKIKSFYENVKSNFIWWVYDVSFVGENLPNIKDISVVFVWDSLDYDNIKKVVSSELFVGFKDLKIKKFQMHLESVVQMLDTGKKDLQNSISDWKSLLKQYIDQKYWEQSSKYLEKLKEMKLI